MCSAWLLGTVSLCSVPASSLTVLLCGFHNLVALWIWKGTACCVSILSGVQSLPCTHLGS